MLDNNELSVDAMRLPQLIAGAEQLRRRIIEHLRYDMLHKARALADQEQDAPDLLFESHDYANKLLAQWRSFCTEIQTRIERILAES